MPKHNDRRAKPAVTIAAATGLAVLGWAHSPAFSQDDELYELGEYLAQDCTSCHQFNRSAGGLPEISGWPVEVFIAVMSDYRSGALKNTTMENVARSLSEEEIKALAIYYNQAEKK